LSDAAFDRSLTGSAEVAPFRYKRLFPEFTRIPSHLSLNNSGKKKARSMRAFQLLLSAFAVAADPADRAAPFVFDYPAAFWTGATFRCFCLKAGIVTLCHHVCLDRLGDAVSAGEDFVVAKA
jgi:hypothetical protein